MADADKTILIADDEANILLLLEMELQADGYETICCNDGSEALAKIRETTPAVVLLDWNMPVITGLDVCRRLRETGNALPVIMITARDEMDDKIAALESGADDFISKPFNIREVLARVKALVRRTSPLSSDVMEARDLQLNCAERRCTYYGQEISLCPRIRPSECFIRNPQAPAEHSSFKTWGEDYFGDDNVVDVYVRYLRRKLEEINPERIIQTVRGIGFALRFEDQA